jgi:hypothetical protein
MAAIPRWSQEAPNPFIGRTQELKDLARLLHDEHRSVIVTGAPGIGKTALAQAYTREHAGRYEAVVIVRPSEILSADALWPAVAQQLNLPDFWVQPYELTEYFQKTPALLVLDGFDEASPELFDVLVRQLGYFLRQRNRTLLLCTSREIYLDRYIQPTFDAIQADADYHVYRLVGLSNSDLLQWLTDRSGSMPDELLEALAVRTLGHPQLVRLLTERLMQQDPVATWQTIEQAYAEHWRDRVSNILVIPTQMGLRAVPALRDLRLGVFTPNGQLAIGAPYIHARSGSVFWRKQLDRFDELLNDESAKERNFQEFFERNPLLLLGVDYKRAIPHPILAREPDGPLIPDFFLQPLDGAFCDVLELKLPTSTILAGSKNRVRLSSSVSEAIAQLREYRDYFDDPTRRKAVDSKYGVTAYKPMLAVVIGRSPRPLAAEQYRRVLAEQPGIKLITYDDLRRRLERIAEGVWF